MALGHDTWYNDRVPITGTESLAGAWAGRHGRGDKLQNRERHRTRYGRVGPLDIANSCGTLHAKQVSSVGQFLLDSLRCDVLADWSKIDLSFTQPSRRKKGITPWRPDAGVSCLLSYSPTMTQRGSSPPFPCVRARKCSTIADTSRGHGRHWEVV